MSRTDASFIDYNTAYTLHSSEHVTPRTDASKLVYNTTYIDALQLSLLRPVQTPPSSPIPLFT